MWSSYISFKATILNKTTPHLCCPYRLLSPHSRTNSRSVPITTTHTNRHSRRARVYATHQSLRAHEEVSMQRGVVVTSACRAGLPDLDAASSSYAFAWSAHSFTATGQLSTRAFTSFRPSLVIPRAVFITATFVSSKTRQEHVELATQSNSSALPRTSLTWRQS